MALHAPELAELGRRGGGLELELEARVGVQRDRPAGVRLERPHVSPGSASSSQVASAPTSAPPSATSVTGSRPANSTPSALPPSLDTPARASPKKPAVRSANANVLASVKPSPPARTGSLTAPLAGGGSTSTSTAVPSTSPGCPPRGGGPAPARVRAATIMRSAKRLTSTRRTSARVSGISSANPRMSVRKPGVSSSAPPKITSTPSSVSRAGGRPACSASLKRRHATRPCERISSEPRIESAIRIPIVHQTPIAWPTWMITASSAIGTTMKRKSSSGSMSPLTLRRALCAA